MRIGIVVLRARTYGVGGIGARSMANSSRRLSATLPEMLPMLRLKHKSSLYSASNLELRRRELFPRQTPSNRRTIFSLSPGGGAPQPLDSTGDPSSSSDPQGNTDTVDIRKQKRGDRYKAALDSALGTFAGIVLLATAGITYHHWYKYEVHRKMRRAFAAGYDPVLALAQASMYETEKDEHGQMIRKPGRIRRKEQDYIDRVINGEVNGEYILLLGPKGVGKTSMITEAMIANEADGVAMLEAHEDPEVIRLRLGKALDFEYNEDSFAGLFQRRDPREAGPILDIERALSKLEKVAIRYRKERGRPLVLIFNNIHFIHDDDAGHALLHMLQQRAEQWAQAGVLTMVFSSDNFHPYRHLKKSATRMHVLSIQDLTPAETHTYLSGTYSAKFPDSPKISPQLSLKIWDLVGGRLSFLSRLTRKEDLIEAAKEMIELEKGWLLHRLGLIPDHDDDVMDEQKVSSCSFLLFQEFAKLAEASEKISPTTLIPEMTLISSPQLRTDSLLDNIVLDEEAGITDSERQVEQALEEVLQGAEEDILSKVLTEGQDPKLEYVNAREIMTRPDYIEMLDHHNIINVDVMHHVRPDSRLMLSVFREVCSQDGFQEKLDNVRDRIDEIESLHRTSELTVKSGGADLGGFLRLRFGQLTKEFEKVKDDNEGDKEATLEDDESGADKKEKHFETDKMFTSEFLRLV